MMDEGGETVHETAIPSHRSEQESEQESESEQERVEAIEKEAGEIAWLSWWRKDREL